MILVGGSTKSTIIRELLQRDYPDVKINFSLKPDESVALGAGIQAYRTKYGTQDVQVFDVLPLAIGVLSDGYIAKQIDANTTIPYSAYSVYSTIKDNQDMVSVAVYQGNSVIKEECTYLGNLLITDIPRKPAGEVKVFVNLSIDARGILKCSVSVNGKKTEKELVNLLKGDIKKPVNKVANKKLIRWRNFAETLESEKKSRLTLLLNEYESNPSVEETIVSLIREYRERPDLYSGTVYETTEA